MAARSRATSRSASRGDTSLRAAINELVGALPLGSLTKRLASVESALGRLEREARRVLGGVGPRGSSAGGAGERATAKRAAGKKSATKRATAKRTTAKKSTAKRSTAAPTARAESKRSTAAKRPTTTRARGGSSSRGAASSTATARPRRGARSSVPPVTGGGIPSAMGEEGLTQRREQLLSELGPAPRAFSEPPGTSPDDDDLASEELTFAANAPETPGPLP